MTNLRPIGVQPARLSRETVLGIFGIFFWFLLLPGLVFGVLAGLVPGPDEMWRDL